MILTDTHTHIYYEQDELNLLGMITRCVDQNIHRLFLPNVDIASQGMIDKLVQAYPAMCFAMAGLHPCSVKENYELEIDQIKAHVQTQKIYAIGEIGIDLYWDKSTLTIQREAFARQIEWAKAVNLPIVIHCREAFDEVFEVLEGYADAGLRGIFHCFTGNIEQANRAIELGFYLGIGGVVTYKKSGLDQVLSEISLDHIVLETDSPYLAPVPFRGKPNESSYLIHIANKLTEIYQVDLAKIAEITTANSKLIFGI
ncbi:MAG: TatD family deoxyribonuclease [Pedobacter sp.]|nr:MAG: TatD family deoxyribonuclease [Pedobacter sp.]